jgi:hypothetical protein
MSGRYQSRLLSMVHTQVQHLQDTLALRWRQIKHSTAWTAQYLLHTLDQLFYTVRRAGFQLKQAVYQGQSLAAAIGKKSAPPSDQPVCNVLKAIEVSALPSASAPAGALVTQQGAGIVTLKSPPAKSPSLWKKIIKAGQVLQQFVSCPDSRSKSLKAALTHIRAKLTIFSQPAPAQPALIPAIQIQGVATLLTSRRLVLTTTEQDLLDILTPEQQQVLHQRIVWEVASYWYARKRNVIQRLGCRLQLPPWVQPLHQLATVPVRLQLSHWRTVAILPAQAIKSFSTKFPKLAGRSLLQLNPAGTIASNLSKPHPIPFLSKWRTILAGTVGAIALLPFTLFATPPARANTAPALPIPPVSMPLRLEWAADPNRSRKRWLSWGDVFGGKGEASQGKIHVASEKGQAKLTATELQQAIATWAAQFSDPTLSGQRDTIDVKAQPIGYELRFLDWLLKGLDQGLAWLENTLVHLWTLGWPILKQWGSALWTRLLKR